MKKSHSGFNKKNILVVTSTFPRYRDDWWGQFICKIYENLPQERFRVTILAPHSPRSKLTEKWGNIVIIRFPYFFPFFLERLTTGNGVLHSMNGIFAKLQVAIFLLSECIFMLYLLIFRKFNVVHVHWILPQGFFAIILKKIFKIPVIVSAHGSDIFGLQKLNFIKSFILNNSTVVTTNSTVTQSKILNICPKSNLLLFPEGVDVTLFNYKKRDMQWRKKINKDNKIILAVGRLIECKGFEFLIKAMPKILDKFPDAKLIIVGSGPEENNLKQIAEKLGLVKNIIFFASMPHDKLSVMYASSDIFVSPSITDIHSGEKEALGIVIIEAIASGIPVVASNSGGIKDTVDGSSTGFLTEEANPDDIANKVIILLSNSKLRKKIITNGLRYVRNKYTWDIIGKKYSELFEKYSKSRM